MTTINHVGQIVFDQNDLCHYIMQGHDLTQWHHVTHSPDIDPATLSSLVDHALDIHTWHTPAMTSVCQEDFDRACQSRWHMPQQYRDLDIAEWVLNQCANEEELQRCGQELMLFQERGLFDLLRYLRYLVDVMTDANIVWGVGRGSSVASYVLYKIGIHRIDSLYYDLDPREFLR